MFLIVGGDSEIGAAAFRAMKAQGKAVAATTRRSDHVASDRPFLDLAAPLDGWTLPPGTQAVCLCAAVARLAACAKDPHGSAHINVVQTLALAEKLLARGIAVLFLSTNQVFDGRTPFQRAEAPHSPISEYGRQKARAEAALLRQMENGAPVAILRLAKVMSDTMPLICGWIKDLTASKPIRVFNDLALAPTPTNLVCSAIAALLQDRARGIFQLTGPRDVTYADIGRFLAGYLGAEPKLVNETSAREAGLPEGATPLNTTLDSSIMRVHYALEVPDVWEVVKCVAANAANTIASPHYTKSLNA
jgi:dTDP-4-dehydrorhamnose reductase